MLQLLNPTTLGILLLFSIALILFLKRRYSFWTSKGVYQVQPRWFLGNSVLNKGSDEKLSEFYAMYKKKGLKYGGVYLFLQPVFLPIDQQLLKNILVKDFEYIMNHELGAMRDKDPLSGHLLNLEGSKWKTMRNILTPTFTSGKMKMMYQIFVECTEGLKKMVETYAITNEPIDIKEILGRFTTDIIGSCAFGLECNAMENADSNFRIYGKKIFDFDMYKKFKLLFILSTPKFIRDTFGMNFFDKDTRDFFINLVKDVVTYREKNNISRPDFMQLLLQLKHSNQHRDENGQPIFSMNEIVANCFVFFLAGFETSSTTMTYTLYELSKNKDIQTKLREEIKSVLAEHDNQVSYEAIQSMNYLELVLKESLRRHAPVGALTRVINKNYNVPDTNIILERGTAVHISVRGIHMDEEYYPNPEKFDPERFTEENKAKRPAFTWMPFGEGPRQCIGLRFGLLQSKIGLVTLLKDYEISVNSKTREPLALDPNAVVSSVVGGVWLNVRKI